MIISHQHRFVFLHNPKAAGTSVREALARLDSYEGRFWGVRYTRAGLVDLAHMPAATLVSLYPELLPVLRDYTVFAFTRAPVPRFVSAFNEQLRYLYQARTRVPALAGAYQAAFNRYAHDFICANGYRHRHRHAQLQTGMLRLGSEWLADIAIPIEAPQAGLQVLASLNPVAAQFVAKGLQSRANRKPVPGGFAVRDDIRQLLEQRYEPDAELLRMAQQAVLLRGATDGDACVP